MLENVRSGSATLEKKLYRLVIASLDGERIGEESYRSYILELAERGICGFIVSGGSKEDLRPFLRHLGEKDLLIASEIEAGPAGRIRGLAEFPSFMALAAARGDDPERLSLLRHALTALASEVMDCGINTLVVPADEEPREPLQEDGSWAGIRRECIRTLQETGLLVCERFSAETYGTTHGPNSVGTSLDAGRLIIAAQGNGGCGELAASLDEGGYILIGSRDADAMVREFAGAVASGLIDEGQVDKALAGIDRVKAQTGEPQGIEVDRTSTEGLAREISRMAVTMVKGKGRFFPVRESDNIPLIYAGEEEYFLTSPLRYYVKQASHISRPLASKERPAMFLLFGGAASGRLASDSWDDEMDVLARLVRGTSPSIVVSFGSPYALARFKDADVLIAAYDATAHSQEAVFKCVTGESGFHGRLPVRLDISDRKGRRR